MIVTITGSSGFVGSNFVRMSPELEIREIDLLVRNIDQVDFHGSDSVLHLAALVHQMKGAAEEEYYRINRDLAFNTAMRAKDHGVRHFVLMSTVKVYGESNISGVAFDEESQCHPSEPYSKSKFEAENLIRDLEDDNFKVAIVRSPIVYGAGVKANMLSLIRLVQRFPLLPLGGINNERTMVYAGNLVAMIKAIISGRKSGIFLAADEVALSTTQLILLIAKAMNKKIYLFKIPEIVVSFMKLISPGIIDRLFGSLVFDNRKTIALLGLRLPFSTEEGIREMVSWYLEGS
jgi:nucleoside-diphosphate-sugar epimerase